MRRASPVLFAVNDFPPVLGGESTLYYGLARHLPRGEFLILAPSGRGAAEVDASLGVEVVRRWLPAHRGTPSRVIRGALASLSMARLLAARRAGYLLCGQLLSLGVPTRALARLARLPYAVFVHGADLADYQGRFPWSGLARWVVAGAEVVIVNSRFTADLVAGLLPGAARRVVVLPMGVDPPRRAAAPEIERLKRRYGLGEGPVLLSVARLIEIKGHDIVIESLPDLLERFPQLSYLIVGSGPSRPRLERLAAERGVAGRVVFAGAVPSGDLPAHFALATLFVQLSRLGGHGDGVEGFGLSLLEAASYGLPVIAGRTGGVPEAVREGRSGLLVPPLEPHAFAAAVVRLLADPQERARMSRDARRWAGDHSWERSARRLLAALRDGRAGAVRAAEGRPPQFREDSSREATVFRRLEGWIGFGM